MIRIQIGTNEPKTITETEIEEFRTQMDIVPLGHESYSLIHKNKSHEIDILNINKETKTILLRVDGITTEVKVATKMDLLLEKMGIDTSSSQKLSVLKAPMPGLVIEWFITEGQEVKLGDKLLVLEAMKMENVIKSPGEGVVKRILIEKGKAIEKNQILVEFN